MCKRDHEIFFSMPVLFHVAWCSSWFCNKHLLSCLRSSIAPLCVDRHFSISTFHSCWQCSIKQRSEEPLPSSILSNAQTKSTWRSHIWSTVTTESCSYRSTTNRACSGLCIRQAHTWVLKVNESTGYWCGWGAQYDICFLTPPDRSANKIGDFTWDVARKGILSWYGRHGG